MGGERFRPTRVKPGIDALLVSGKLEEHIAALFAEVEAVVAGAERAYPLFSKILLQTFGEFSRAASGAFFTPTDVQHEVRSGLIHTLRLASRDETSRHA